MSYFWQITLVLSAVIISTRSLPFVFAKFMGQRFNEIGRLLPAYIMLLLVIYEIGLKNFTTPPYALPAIIALGLLTLVHWWLRNTFVSLFVGTACYMALNYLIFPH